MIKAHEGNDGLTVRINLWPAQKQAERSGVENTWQWIGGFVTNADTNVEVPFNSSEELIEILDKWNKEKWGV